MRLQNQSSARHKCSVHHASGLVQTGSERLLYVLRVFGGHLEQAAAVSPESAHRTDVFRWAEAGLQQSYRVQILNPLTVGHITLAAADGLQRMRVDQIDLEATLFQNLKQWDPVHPGALHRYLPAAPTLQPLGQGV